MTAKRSNPVKLAGSIMTVGVWTLLSRVLGMGREVLLYALIGAGPLLDAFIVAFRLPNMFRRFTAEGAFNAAFVLLYAKRIEQDGEAAADGFASEAAAALFFIVALLVIIFEMTMPWSLNIIGFGLDKAPAANG